ncbi:MAG: hypothetical protein UT34_C0001G0099 [candidate division WS6 bacterium GW2011_GWF2_39_15]|uniref:Uncharacterized protein n=1 Tax=candidate division WS6 bacterium GW2011_GWF2_39_15 TaxID=1619100 RepID=A0A0G0MPS0_9BACT|nr:MAG: hypothetical protein UT34_C0001G0099 [candidate division WS6 bacterium GW2011_GWF2_39_15]
MPDSKYIVPRKGLLHFLVNGLDPKYTMEAKDLVIGDEVRLLSDGRNLVQGYLQDPVSINILGTHSVWLAGTVTNAKGEIRLIALNTTKATLVEPERLTWPDATGFIEKVRERVIPQYFSTINWKEMF